MSLAALVLHNIYTKPISLRNITINFLDWIQKIRKDETVSDGPIHMAFMLWTFWKARCTCVFEGGQIKQRNLVHMINKLSHEWITITEDDKNY